MAVRGFSFCRPTAFSGEKRAKLIRRRFQENPDNARDKQDSGGNQRFIHLNGLQSLWVRLYRRSCEDFLTVAESHGLGVREVGTVLGNKAIHGHGFSDLERV